MELCTLRRSAKTSAEGRTATSFAVLCELCVPLLVLLLVLKLVLVTLVAPLLALVVLRLLVIPTALFVVLNFS